MSKEKMFPVTMTLVLMVVVIALYTIVDAYTQITSRGTAYLSRVSSDTHYWAFYKFPYGNAPLSVAKASGNAISVPVLLYHGEGDDAVNPPLSVIVEQMRALKQDGWQTISLQQFHDFMKHGTPVPDRSFLLTFDDGRRDTFYPFDPVMKDLGFTGVMYVITAFSLPETGRPSRFYLNGDELQYMVDSGRWELQSHGHEDHRIYRVQSTTDLAEEAETVEGYFLSNKFWNDAAGRFETDAEYALRIREDLETSRDILERHFGRSVYSFAYPFNDMGQESINYPEAIEVLGELVPSVYTFAFYQHWSGNGDSFNYPDPDIYMVRRIEPKSDWSGADLIERMNFGRAKQLPYRVSEFTGDWLIAWGKGAHGDMLVLESDKATSASSFLDGTGSWTDYRFEADIDRISGSSVSLIARNVNDTSYILCAFSDGVVAIEEQGPETFRKALVRKSISMPLDDVALAISVKGQTASCYISGEMVASAKFSGHEKGGIGAEVWDPVAGNAKSEFDNVSVQEI